MKKITLLIHSLATGGAERVCINQANYFASEYKVTILVFNKKTTIYSIDPRVKIRSLHIPEGFFLRLIWLWGPIRLWTMKQDLVISHLWEANLIAALYHILFRERVILVDHNNPRYSQKFFSPLCRFLCRKLFRYTPALVVLNEGIRSWMIELFRISPERVHVIPNPLYLSAPGKKTPPPFSFRYLLAVGRMAPVKGFDRLLSIFATIVKEKPDLHLVLCGDGPELPNLKRQAERLGISSEVHFQGEIKNLAPYYQHAEALLFTSHYEGFGYVILEAMAYGKCPTIAFDCDYGPSTMIEDRVNGRLIPQNDLISFTEATLDILSNPLLREKWEKSMDKVLQKFSADLIYSKWNILLNKQLDKTS